MAMTLKMLGEVQFLMMCLQDMLGQRSFGHVDIGRRLERIEAYLIRRYNELPRKESTHETPQDPA